MKNDNDLILERLRGIPACPMTLADKYNPRNPNVKDKPANDNWLCRHEDYCLHPNCECMYIGYQADATSE